MRKINKEELEIINKIFSGVTASSSFSFPSGSLSTAALDKAGWWVKLLDYDPQLQLEIDESGTAFYPAIPITTSPVIISENDLGQINNSLSNDELSGDEEIVCDWLKNEIHPAIAYKAIRWRNHFLQNPMFELCLNDTLDDFISGDVYDRLSKIPRG